MTDPRCCELAISLIISILYFSLLESSQLKTAHALVEAAISHINGELGPAIVNSGNLNRVTEQGIIDRFIVEKTNGKKWESHSLMALSMAVCKGAVGLLDSPYVRVTYE